MVLVEVLVEGTAFDARMRFIGSEFVQYFNSEKITGTLLSALDPVFLRRWSEVGERVLAARAPLFFHGAPFMVDKAFIRIEMLALPLSKAGEAVDFILLATARI